MRTILVSSLLFLSVGIQAAPLTIDFDFLDDDTVTAAFADEFVAELALESDFYFSYESGDGLVAAAGANWDFGGAGSNGTGYLATQYASEMFFARSGGGSFDLQSLVFSDVTGVQGVKANGEIITIHPTLTPGTWSTMNFDDEWSDLVRVRLGGGSLNANFVPSGNLNLDSLTVNVVPIPAAVWLFGSALAGLGWLRRKTT